MISLYTAGTPNGRKISIMLEELGVEYKVHPVDIMSGTQKEDWFLKLNPNGRIPVIVDHDNDDFVVFESGAILQYLAEKHGKLLPKDEKGRSVVMQWLFFQMAGVGPMMGQSNVFTRYASERIPYAIERYQGESQRLLGVLNDRLKNRDFLADDYSIADIATFPWVVIHLWSGVEIDDMPHLQAWIDRIWERDAVKRGMNIPSEYEPFTKERVAELEKEVAKRIRSMLNNEK